MNKPCVLAAAALPPFYLEALQVEMSGARPGLVGMGHIGRAMAALACESLRAHLEGRAMPAPVSESTALHGRQGFSRSHRGLWRTCYGHTIKSLMDMRMIKNVHGNTVDLLGEAIVSGRYAPGASLPPEPILGEELGVSRTVVREVIKSLIAKGLVTTGPKVGTRVLPEDQWSWFDPDIITWRSKAGITSKFLRDLQDLRQIVEPGAVRLAAQRATPQDIKAMEEAFAGMERALRNGGDYVTHDLLFHQGLLRAADNRLLLHMSRILSALLRTSFELSTLKEDGPIRSLPLHRAVLDAVAAGDPERAERAIRVLINSAHQDIQEVLTPQGQTKAKRTAQAARPKPLRTAPATPARRKPATD